MVRALQKIYFQSSKLTAAAATADWKKRRFFELTIVKNEFLGIKKEKMSDFLLIMVLNILKFTIQTEKNEFLFLSTVK